MMRISPSFLTTAATALLQAGAQLLATAVPEPDEPGTPRHRNVEPIHLDDDEA